MSRFYRAAVGLLLAAAGLGMAIPGGWLIGLDRQIRENFKVGVGYNFTDFSGDLTQLDYRHKGWFLNITGYY